MALNFNIDSGAIWFRKFCHLRHPDLEGYKSIRLMCLVASPQGVKAVTEMHPDVDIYLASLDEGMNEKNYILPGLGDAGDRIFGTR